MSTAPHTEERSTAAGTGFALKRVKIRNYKSIASCDVELGPFTILVGRNGSGKSNFLDAIRFVGDALRDSLEHAVRGRTLWSDVADASTELSDFQIELSVTLPSGDTATYGLRLGARH